ncbi:leucine-rich repeat domain-containing protein [Anditalea andensis]|uniref:Internalin n=1 Tax=Anditalea andensis TaxID=1048983 RepID=A0A074KRH2_9BACT|nr:leucine-rich repeat domain-containing protein [Anditalea andensis]KEO72541.1 internalin [Anditalea andensis]
MIKNRYLNLIVAFWLTLTLAQAQELGSYSKQEVKDFSQKAEDQVKFLEYFLNTVGSKETSARDKDVIIRESYVKIFRDGKVQVEDDLLLDRKVITNKDVTAYLKDVDFFFRDANFSFKVKETKPFLRDNGELSFLVSIDRTLSGVGIEGEKIQNIKPRFIEINLDPKSNDLKIASMYTTKLSRDKELTEWWETLSYEWRSYFEEKFSLDSRDSVDIDMISRMSAIDSLNLGGKRLIQDLSPIQALRDLKYINISNTNIADLSPISHVTYLSYLDISNTPTEDIQFLKYSETLNHLDLSGTKVFNIDELGGLKNLKVFKVANAPIRGFGVLKDLTNLEELDLAESGFNNLQSIKELHNLKRLDLSGNYLTNYDHISELKKLEFISLDETNITDLSPLQSLESLKTVSINQTEVSTLQPLNNNPSLQRIYADRTSIPEQVADDFTRKNRKVLLIHNVENLQTWWNTLPDGWREVLNKNYKSLSSGTPNSEELAILVGSESLDLSNSNISSLRPVIKFKKIEELNISDSKIQDLSPLSELRTLEKLYANNTAVTNVESLENLTSLEIVHLKNTPIKNIKPLTYLVNLVYLDMDGTEVPKWEVQNLLNIIPAANVVYRTEALKGWWNQLDTTWKDVFTSQYKLSDQPDTRELHKATSSRSIKLKGINITDLEPLVTFVNLKEVEISDVPLQDISAIALLESLEKLSITQAPIMSVTPLANLSDLQELDLSNTGVEDLRPLSSLTRLSLLNLSGTNIKRLNGLENLYDLRNLDIANTNSRSLKPILNLSNLEQLKCFNTRINKRQVDNFKKANPECDVRYY